MQRLAAKSNNHKKKSHDLEALDITTLFGKLIKNEDELKRLKVREANGKKTYKAREEKRKNSLEAFASKAKVEEYNESTGDNDSPK